MAWSLIGKGNVFLDIVSGPGLRNLRKMNTPAVVKFLKGGIVKDEGHQKALVTELKAQKGWEYTAGQIAKGKVPIILGE